MLSRKQIFRSAALLPGLAFLITEAKAQQAGPITTADIIRRGRARIGVVTGAPPFGMVDPQGNAIGYDIDVANRLAFYLGVPAEISSLTPPSRIPALEAGRVDFLCATLGATPERARTVMFTMPYSAFRMMIMAKKETAITKIEDLAGKRVGVPRGTPQEQAMVRRAPRGTTIVRFEDDATSAQALIVGQVDAIGIPDTIGGDIAKTRPEAGLENKIHLFNQPNCMTTRKDQFEMRQWLQNTIYFMKTNGELDEIAQKWTGSPLPADLPAF
ncbi:transporter substrate-binding domain-containing protein [Paracraurococcus ruber]|uniref:LacI family transcriptional regulator n=1 Tax=Paracraurococcus ruber TaxID=77675 RepID=A0ABS1CTZ6_9PROT|nr:transporter substrate-binding domain-containing protein [Paracraurococcus ruber]MBK1657823.1 LacI family transcriptional regulator [Paracraurococcus ruber]TDG31398.1 transporter substrate-binding domain-containing protein [Paracraurococcus ruber]